MTLNFQLSTFNLKDMEFTVQQIADYLKGTVEGDGTLKVSELSKGFIERRFFKAVSGDDMLLYNTENLKRQYAERFGIDEGLARYFYVEEAVRSNTYNPDGANIMIMYSDGRLDDVAHASDMMNVDMMREMIEKRYLFYMPIYK